MTSISFLSLIPEYCALFILVVLIFINKCKIDARGIKSDREKNINNSFIKCELVTLFIMLIDIVRFSTSLSIINYITAILFHCYIIMLTNCITSYIYEVLPSLKEKSYKFYNLKNKIAYITILAMFLLAPTGVIYGYENGEVTVGKLYFISYITGVVMFAICICGAYKSKVSRTIRFTMYLIIACTFLPCIFEVVYKQAITSGIGFVAGLLIMYSMFHDGVFNMEHGTQSFASLSNYLKRYKRKECKIVVFTIKSLDKKKNSEEVSSTKHSILLSLKKALNCEAIFDSNKRYAFVVRETNFDDIASIWNRIISNYTESFKFTSIVIDKKYLSDVNFSILSEVELNPEITNFSDADMEKVNRKEKIKRTIQSIVNNDGFEDDRIITMVQPIMDLKEKKFLTGEMLTRLKVDGIDDIVMPYEFIPVVESLGVIHKFNLCILDSACKLMRKIKSIDSDFDSISVNFDPSEFSIKSFVQDVTYIVYKNNITPNCIHIEVTEANEMDDSHKTSKCINELIDLGFEVYLDDFGTKYSNMVELLSFKFNVLKLDRQLIIKALNDETARKVVTALSSACSAVGYKVLFEGVDSDTGVQLAHENGASYIQGFYYSKPLAWDDFIEFVTNKNTQLLCAN